MMRLVSSVVGSAVFLTACLCIASAADLRGSLSTSSTVDDDKPTIGLYMNGGDFITELIIAETLIPLYLHSSDCLATFNYNVTHYGMTEEKDGKFYCEKALGGQQNVDYLKAVNCLQYLSPTEKDSSYEVAEGLVLFDAFFTSWEDMKSIMSESDIKTVKQCMDTKGDNLLHEAGVKTNKDVVFDFRKTLDMAITINGKQDIDALEGLSGKLCEWSGNKDVCCKHQAQQDTMNNLAMLLASSSSSSSSSSRTPSDKHKAIMTKFLGLMAQVAIDDVKHNE